MSKTRKPHLDSEIDPSLLAPPHLLDEAPPNMILDDFWVVDQSYPQALLGPGVVEWESSVSIRFIDGEDRQLAVDAHTESKQSETSSSSGNSNELKTQVGQHDQSQNSSAKSSLLDESRELTEGLDVFDSIARAAKKAMDVGRFFSTDHQDTSTAEFWLRSYCSHLKVAYQQFQAQAVSTDGNSLSFGDSQKPHVKAYLMFIVKCLLGSECFHCLGKFTEHFAAIKQFAPELVPPFASALEVLQKDCIVVSEFKYQIIHCYHRDATKIPLICHYDTTNVPRAIVLPLMCN